MATDIVVRDEPSHTGRTQRLAAVPNCGSELLQDAGVVNGMFGNTPVLGSAGFLTAQTFEVGATGISAIGQAAAEASVGYGYVSAGADAVSSLRPSFSVNAATPFSVWGSLLNGGASAPAIVTQAPVSAASSSSWRFTSTGDFSASGTLQPGTWVLYASASASATPGQARQSDFGLSLQLAPVPEPGAWAPAAAFRSALVDGDRLHFHAPVRLQAGDQGGALLLLAAGHWFDAAFAAGAVASPKPHFRPSPNSCCRCA